MERLLLRPSEVAEALGVSRTKAYELIARGELPSVRVGHSLRVSADDLAAWIQRLRETEFSGEETPASSGI